ncbi:MAG: thioredoxin-disulfide reductase [Aerococcus sp.]|nr:thioredoxin-disulfide reductase [Aerococcus sp.]
MSEMYDVIIVGGGPAGLTAALYTSRARMKTVVLERQKFGGQITITEEIANYPGAVIGEGEEPSGQELIDRMVEQAQKFGAELKNGEDVVKVDLNGDVKRVECKNGNAYEGKAVIISAGANPRKLGCPGEAELAGKGVSYCATCDGALFEDLEIYVVGGGNAAVEEAAFLANLGRKVTIIQNLSKLTADPIAIEQLKNFDNIEVIYNSIVTEIKGDGMVEGMTIKNTETGEETEIEADEEDGIFGIFIFIGYIPSSGVFKEALPADDYGYLVTNEDMSTSIPGVYVAGDIRPKSLRQVITATSDGAVAARSAQHYVESQR